MKTKQIKTGVADILLVELPDGVGKPKLWVYGNYIYTYSDGIEKDIVDIPLGYKILSRADEVTEGQAKGIVQSALSGETAIFKNYCDENDYEHTALESLDSLYEANDVLWENPLGAYPTHPSYTGSGWSLGEYQKMIIKWKESQSKVWDKTRTYILIKQKQLGKESK